MQFTVDLQMSNLGWRIIQTIYLICIFYFFIYLQYVTIHLIDFIFNSSIVFTIHGMIWNSTNHLYFAVASANRNDIMAFISKSIILIFSCKILLISYSLWIVHNFVFSGHFFVQIIIQVCFTCYSISIIGSELWNCADKQDMLFGNSIYFMAL